MDNNQLISPMYSLQTGPILVSVEPVYLDEQSHPDEDHFVWAYHIRIENKGDKPVQLKSRHWQITDSFGRRHEVRGPGVVGEQPVIGPGEIYEYTSGTPLNAPSGIMFGSYEMETCGEGEAFDVTIPAFSLDSPHQNVRYH